MFTGIIEEIGTVRSVSRSGAACSLKIQASHVLEGCRVGDSIAVNGVCLTVTALADNSFTAALMPETLRMTSLGRYHVPFPVNLERAMAADGRFGGHIVSGHIDGTGTVLRKEREGNAVWVYIRPSSYPVMQLRSLSHEIC